MTHPDCLSDLVSRARRYRLSRAEQARLDEHLSECSSCRLERAIGADFDAVGGLQAGDDKLIARVAATVAARPRWDRSGTRARVRSVCMAVAAACALVAAAAGADVLLARQVLRIQPQTLPISAQPVLPAAPEMSRATPLVNLNGFAADVPTAPRPIAVRERRAARPTPLRPTSPPADAVTEVEPAHLETTEALFARANNARRQNHVASAISLYGELERRFPRSEEAIVSRVSLGRLLIERGISSDGLSQLDDYLASSPNGALAPEALFGKACALQALGRHDDERSAWHRLLSTFPDSVYSAQARRRIEELR